MNLYETKPLDYIVPAQNQFQKITETYAKKLIPDLVKRNCP